MPTIERHAHYAPVETRYATSRRIANCPHLRETGQFRTDLKVAAVDLWKLREQGRPNAQDTAVEAWEGYEPRPLDEAESKVFREFYARLGDTLAVRVKHVIDADALRKHDLERSDTAADFEAF